MAKGKLSDVDFKALGNLIRVIVEDVLDQKLDEKLKYLPTKKEFYERMDKLSKEIEENREASTISEQEKKQIEERITALEEIHPQGRHVTK